MKYKEMSEEQKEVERVKFRLTQKRRREKDPAKHYAYQKQYRENNKEKFRAWQRKSRAKRKAEREAEKKNQIQVNAVKKANNKQSNLKDDNCITTQPQKILLDLNLPPPLSPTNEDESALTNPIPKVQKTEPKRVEYPHLTQEERTRIWREKKRKARAKLSPEVKLARSRRDGEVKKKKIESATPEEQEVLRANYRRYNTISKRKSRAKLKAERLLNNP